MAQKWNIFTNSTNLFLRKIKSLVQLTEGAILCTVDFVGLYPNMPHEEGLTSLRKFLDANFSFIRTETETLLELAEIVLKNIIFQFNERT